jgi:hypothetical protein
MGNVIPAGENRFHQLQRARSWNWWRLTCAAIVDVDLALEDSDGAKADAVADKFDDTVLFDKLIKDVGCHRMQRKFTEIKASPS